MNIAFLLHVALSSLLSGRGERWPGCGLRLRVPCDGTREGFCCLVPTFKCVSLQISDWRLNFANPTAWFSFVQLEPWIAGPGTFLAQFRDAQLAALALPATATATGIDI